MAARRRAEAETESKDARRRIVEAAGRVFAEQGYVRATTRAIAAAADVNEVTLFRLFGDKKNILTAVVERYSAVPGLAAAIEKRLTGDARRDLEVLGGHFLKTMFVRSREILMTMFEAHHFPELNDVVRGVPARQGMMLGEYLRSQMDQGRLRRMDPLLAAQAFLGMLFAFGISYKWISPSLKAVPVEDVLRQFVRIFLDGLTKKKAGYDK